jgi:uncharacterized protein
MPLFNELGRALQEAGSMTWQITWSLILGFTLSAVVQAVVRREAIARHLGGENTRTLALATGLGAASSSCSYAAVALARALVRRGASFTAAMAFEIASTNLVIELGIILALLLSWQFTLAEFTGGPIMIVLMAVAFRLFVRKRTIAAARAQADKGLAGSMEGHAAMDMSIGSGGGFWQRLASREGYTSVSRIFVMEWAAVIRDIILGLLIAGMVNAAFGYVPVSNDQANAALSPASSSSRRPLRATGTKASAVAVEPQCMVCMVMDLVASEQCDGRQRRIWPHSL